MRGGAEESSSTASLVPRQQAERIRPLGLKRLQRPPGNALGRGREESADQGGRKSKMNIRDRRSARSFLSETSPGETVKLF